MAVQTVSWKAQKLNIFGPTPTNNWNQVNWGSPTTWGYKAAGQGNAPGLVLGISKNWSGSNNLSISLPTAGITRAFARVWGAGKNAITFKYANSDKERYSGNGYHYLYIDNVTNIESAAANAYAQAANVSSSWTTLAGNSTTWSQS